jgi:hypothetical protein
MMTVNDLLIYKNQNAVTGPLQSSEFTRETDGIRLTGAAARKSRQLTYLVAKDDMRRVKTNPAAEPTLLFLSEQYHESWRAYSETRVLQTVPVNAFFLGVLVPPGTRQVEVRFKPHARRAWIAHAVFAIAGLAFVLDRVYAGIAIRRGRRPQSE